MKRSRLLLLFTTSLSIVGCNSAHDTGEETAAELPASTPTVTEVDAASLPAEVTSVVAAAVPGIQIEGAERKEREERIYYDVQGTRPDGSEVELDLLEENGQYKVVEIQRDISWSEAPEAARSAAAASPKAFMPVRVIESVQANGTVIYELFAQGAPEKPALEVRVVAGKAEVLRQEWPH